MYSNFIVKTLITTSDKKTLTVIQQSFSGHICELLQDPFGTTVIDKLYHASKAHHRNKMSAEFYGRDFMISKSKNYLTLNDYLSKYPKKRNSIITNIAVSLIP